jgi:urease accessory protein
VQSHPSLIEFLPRLLQLASPTLPVGAYSYSQGLESAVEQRTVIDEPSATAWIEDAFMFTIASFEGPMLRRMYDAAELGAAAELAALNATFLAARESAELRAETVQMGRSLCRLLAEIEETRPALLLIDRLAEPSYPCAWACAAFALGLPRESAYCAYLWAWTEGQVMAAVKLVPLGQSAGQRMLMRIGHKISALAARADLDEDALSNFAPGLALASSAHETQYSRLFRS